MIRNISLTEGRQVLRGYQPQLCRLANNLSRIQNKRATLYLEAGTGLRWHQLFRGIDGRARS